VALRGEVQGKIHTVASAPIVNLSMAGALVEVPCTLRVGAAYTMRLAIGPDKFVDVKGKVVRSYVHGFDKNEKGETVIKYRAAVQFLDLPVEHQSKLERFLQGLGKEGLRADLRSQSPI
jgi:hypothetical protein